MSKSIAFDRLITWTTKWHLAYRMAITSFEAQLSSHREFAPVLEKQELWESLDRWDFSTLSLDALRQMLGVTDRTLEEFDGLFTHVTDDETRRQSRRELIGLRRTIAARIAWISKYEMLGREASGIALGGGLYWLAPHDVVQQVVSYLCRDQHKHPDLEFACAHLDNSNQLYLGHSSFDGLSVVHRLVSQMEEEGYAASPRSTPAAQSTAGKPSAELRMLIEMRMEGA